MFAHIHAKQVPGLLKGFKGGLKEFLRLIKALLLRVNKVTIMAWLAETVEALIVTAELAGKRHIGESNREGRKGQSVVIGIRGLATSFFSLEDLNCIV